MNREDIWKLFKQTGNVNYFMTYKKMLNEGRDKIEYNSSNGDNSKRKAIQ